ncbi:MAG: MarR family winged helix-turn-helix transcriptional regulator [Arachnia sp.]
MNAPPPRELAPQRALQAFTMEAERYMEVARRQMGLGHNDVRGLTAVVQTAQRGGTLTPSGLAEELVLSPAATTALLDRLEGRGHLRRAPSQSDARSVELLPTPQARQVGREMFVVLSEAIQARLDQYSPAEVARFVDMINDLTQATVAARGWLEDSDPGAGAPSAQP